MNGEDRVTKVTYNSRHTSNDLIEKVRKTGQMRDISFGQLRDPCESFFMKVMSNFQAAMGSQASKGIEGVNAAVTIKPDMVMPGKNGRLKQETKATSIENVWVKTDSAVLQSLNPTTLEPIDVARHPRLHPDLKGPFTAAHSRTDPVTGDWYNYNLEIGRQAVYRVFRVSAKTGKTEILATMSGSNISGAYLHSFLLTGKYVVLCIFDAYYGLGGAKVLWTKNMLEAMEFDPERKNVWVVIDRVGDKGVVGMFESDPMFAFHPVNAWDQPSETEPGKFDIFADVPAYENLDVLKRFYYHNLKGTSPKALDYCGDNKGRAPASLKRFKLSGVGTSTIPLTSKPAQVEVVFDVPSADSPELPTFNPRYATKPSRYIFGVCDRGNSTFVDGIIKLDTHTKESVALIIHAHSPGEPIFIPDPNGIDEDDGVCLSVVLDGTQGKSYLLVMDAKSFTEIGRAEMESVVPSGFHGAHVSHL